MAILMNGWILSIGGALSGRVCACSLHSRLLCYPKRRLNGMKKCGENCTASPYILNKKSIKINGIDWKINQNLNCKSFNVVYAITCSKEKCNMTYIGETKRILKFRLDDHRGYVNCNIDCATGSHFTQPGHSLANMKIIALEQVKKSNNNPYRKEREGYFIRKFNTVRKGMNKNTELNQLRCILYCCLFYN